MFRFAIPCRFQRSCSCLIAFWDLMCIPACLQGFSPPPWIPLPSSMCPLIITGFSGVLSCREHKTAYIPPPTMIHKSSPLDSCVVDPYTTLMEGRRCQGRQEEGTLKVKENTHCPKGPWLSGLWVGTQKKKGRNILPPMWLPFSPFGEHRLCISALKAQHKGQGLRVNQTGSGIQISALLRLVSVTLCKLLEFS